MNVFQGKLSNGSLSLDIDFHWFSILDEKLRRLSIAESGSFGFLIVEVSFHGLFINHIKFHGLSFNGTSLFAMHLFDIGPPGVPLSEMVLVLVSPLMKAVSMVLLRWYTISRTFHQSSSIRLISNRFNWFPRIFFQSKRYLRKFNQWNRFARNFLHKLFNFFYDVPIHRLSLKDVQSVEKASLFLTVFKRSFLWILVDGDDFHSFLIDQIVFNGFSDNQVQFRGFPKNQIIIFGFSSIKSVSIGF